MNTADIRQTVIFHASPEQVYRAIMDSAIHSEFTGSTAEIGDSIGDPYSTYNGYINGEILELEPYHRIVKSWIANEEGWPEGHSSEVIFEFNPVDKGTEMQFWHSGIPENKVDEIRKGWFEFYWEPMKEMFENKTAQQTDN